MVCQTVHDTLIIELTGFYLVPLHREHEEGYRCGMQRERGENATKTKKRKKAGWSEGQGETRMEK